MGLHYTKKLLHSKETNRMKWQHTEWERIFANHISEKRLISPKCKEIKQEKQRQNKTLNNPIKNGQRT